MHLPSWCGSLLHVFRRIAVVVAPAAGFIGVVGPAVFAAIFDLAVRCLRTLSCYFYYDEHFRTSRLCAEPSPYGRTTFAITS